MFRPKRRFRTKRLPSKGRATSWPEQWSEDAHTRGWLAKHAAQSGQVVSVVKRGKKEEAAKFEMYFDHREPCKRIPSHRFLAMKRGEAEGLLRVGVALDDDYVGRRLKQDLVRNPQFEFHKELLATVDDCYQRLLQPATESAVLQELKEKADEEAIGVFAKNLRELLLAPPAGPKVTIGIDPGFRTGFKVAVIDETGKYLANHRDLSHAASQRYPKSRPQRSKN